jgi:hypothetical protein
MRSLENRADIKEIEPMLCEIRGSFLFVPFKAHQILCIQFVFTGKPLLSLCRNVVHRFVQCLGLCKSREPARRLRRDLGHQTKYNILSIRRNNLFCLI